VFRLNAGLGVIIKTTDGLDDKEPYACGRNITLSCMFKENSFAVAWRKSNENTPIAKCIQNACDLNSDYVGIYSISFDIDHGIFNLSMLKVNAEENGTKLVCSDGSQSDSFIIKVDGKTTL
jgi:hypothetical protein